MKRKKNNLRKTLKKWMKNNKKKLYKAICGFLASVLLSCGSTKAVVSQPAQGTYTTITITTNNPITTNVEPNTNTTLKLWHNQLQ